MDRCSSLQGLSNLTRPSPIYFSRQVLLLNLELVVLARTTGQHTLHLPPYTQAWGDRHTPAFMWVPGISTQAFRLTQQAPHQHTAPAPRLVLKPQRNLNTQGPKRSTPPRHLLGLNVINPTVAYKFTSPDRSTNPADSICNLASSPRPCVGMTAAGAPQPPPPSDGEGCERWIRPTVSQAALPVPWLVFLYGTKLCIFIVTFVPPG